MTNTFTNICRICLSQTVIDKMFSIFSEDEFGIKISEKIADCSGIIIYHSEILPTMICLDCYQSLAISYKFRQMCLNSEKQLSMLKPNGLVKIENDKHTIKTESTEYQVKSPNCSKDQDSLEFDDNNDSQTDCGNPLLNENVVSSIKKISYPTNKKRNRKKNVCNSVKNAQAKQKEQPLHICEQCGNTYARRCLLSMHIKRHSNIKRFECELCKKKFQTQSEMARHMRTHTGVKPYMCKFCGRKFADRSTNIKHERTHTNERPFVCDTCGKSFTYSNVLKNHILTHTGEKNFKCKPCEKTFSRAHQLKQHFGTLIHQHTLLKSKSTEITEIT